jgi:hypothetical protein
LRVTITSGIVVAGLALGLFTQAAAGARGEGSVGHAPHGKPSSSPPSTTGGTSPSGSGPTSPIAQKIESHPQLASRLKAMLPAGMTLDQAALGFRNQGQFIAAMHVSQNLGIPFASLKTDMVDKHLSLGQSIQALKPIANSTAAAKKGEDEAEHDLKTADAPKTRTKTTTTTKAGKPSTERQDGDR